MGLFSFQRTNTGLAGFEPATFGSTGRYSAAELQPHSTFQKRKEQDSNLWEPFDPTWLATKRHKPLGHPSLVVNRKAEESNPKPYGSIGFQDRSDTPVRFTFPKLGILRAGSLYTV